MKKIALLSTVGFIALSTLFLSSFTPNKNTGDSKYILVEIYEIPSYKDKGVHIHFGGNKRELVPFKEFTTENHDDNGDIILNSINKLTADGYEIASTCSGLSSAGMITKIFMKK